jgi:hypothetical protein
VTGIVVGAVSGFMASQGVDAAGLNIWWQCGTAAAVAGMGVAIWDAITDWKRYER